MKYIKGWHGNTVITFKFQEVSYFRASYDLYQVVLRASGEYVTISKEDYEMLLMEEIKPKPE